MNVMTRTFDRGEAVALGIVTIGVLVYWLQPYENLTIDFVALFVIGTFIYGPVMLIGVAAVDLVPKKAAGSAAGFTGLFGYFAGMNFAEFGIGKVAARIAHLTTDEARGLPTAIRKQHRHHRGGEAHGPTGLHRCRCRHHRRGRDENEAYANEQRDRGQLGHHQGALHVASGTHAHAVDDRQQRERERGHGLLWNAKPGELAKVATEDDRGAGHSSRLCDEQQRPPIEEGNDRMVGVA